VHTHTHTCIAMPPKKRKIASSSSFSSSQGESATKKSKVELDLGSVWQQAPLKDRLYSYLENSFVDIVRLGSVNKNLRNAIYNILAEKFPLPADSKWILAGYHNSMWCYANERKVLFDALKALKEKGEEGYWSTEFLGKKSSQHPMKVWWENFFYYASGEPQKKIVEQEKKEDEEREEEEQNEDESEKIIRDTLYGTYNYQASDIQWLKKEMVAEILLVEKREDEEPEEECKCQKSLQKRQKKGDYYFHDEDCEYGIDGTLDIIVRLNDGRYARILALGSNPRDYNGAAAWCSEKLNAVMNADLDEPYVR